MPKYKRSPPKFLQAKLRSQKMDLVRRSFHPWLKTTQDQHGAQPPMSMELLHDFVDHMGFKDKDFRDISADALKTTHAGTMQIYDYMRKRIGKLDEKQMATPTSKTRAKTTPPGVTAGEKSKDDQANDQEAVRVTAKDIPGKMEEKDVKFYKEKQSSEGIEPAESSNSSSVHSAASSSEAQTTIGHANHQTVKHVFTDMIDANAKIDIEKVSFEWHRGGYVSAYIWTAKSKDEAK